MLQEQNNSSNRNELRKPLLKREFDAPDAPKFPLWKRAVLLAIGFVGLNIIAVFVTLLTMGMTYKDDRSAAVNLISYSILFLAMMGLVFLDIPKFRKMFRGWEQYVVGVLLGVMVIFLDSFYLQFVNLFYPINTGGNETAVRGVIDLYPVASIFILGMIGPLCEELAYRVGLFGLLRKVNIVLAYIGTGVIFGFLHFDYTSANIAQEFILLPSYIIPGIIFSIGYDLFGLPCSFISHSINNLWAIIAHIIATK